MALRGAAARRYADAVFEMAKEQGTLDAWRNSLRTLTSLFGSPGVVAALEDPKQTDAGQTQIVERLLAGSNMEPLAVNLVLLLVRRRRLAVLPRVVELFETMYNREKGIVVADVTTAVPLDEAHRAMVATRLSEITGKKVTLNLREDPRILGGIVARIGDELIDASLATRLASLGERIS